MRKSQWKNKKRKGVFVGKYEMYRGERMFVLINEAAPKDKAVEFNSHEGAKQAGWVKIA